jgi:hypothetical protein
MIIKGKEYTLEELKEVDIDYYNKIIEKQRFSIEVKNLVRYKVINEFKDFSKTDQKMLLKLKKEVFANNEIFIFGSRVNGKYITKKDVTKYKDKYPEIVESDWDVKSLFKPNTEALKKFQETNKVKIDFQIGNNKIKV